MVKHGQWSETYRSCSKKTEYSPLNIDYSKRKDKFSYLSVSVIRNVLWSFSSSFVDCLARDKECIDFLQVLAILL